MSVKIPDQILNPYMKINPEILVLLWALFNDMLALFKSVEQALAYQLEINRMVDELVILEMGGEKSLIIKLLVSIERDKMIVGIVPFISLLMEIKDWFDLLNLIVNKWTSDRIEMD